MPIATVLQNKFSKKKALTIAAAIVIPLVLAGIIAGFFLIQGTISNAGEEAPIGVSASVAPTGEALITFDTAKESTPTVRYGLSPDALTEVAVGDFDSVTHAISIKNLEPNTTYYYSIEIGTELFDNDGALWTFATTASENAAVSPDPIPSIEVAAASGTPSPTASVSATIIPTPSIASPAASITPKVSGSPTPSVSGTITPAATVATSSSVCKSNNCVSILSYLGTQCSTQDYVKCIQNVNITITQAPTNSPTPTPVSAELKAACGINYLQPNTCTDWIWDDVSAKSIDCANTFPQYFVQCKNSSWDEPDTGTWYCNERVSTNSLTLPCAAAPTPVPGQSTYCRVRAETQEGGDANSTDWVYTSSSCGRIDGDDVNCEINYVQANSCTSWIWDFDYQKDPRCNTKFDHYFMQCTDDGLFDSNSFWYCNMTMTDHYNDLPCFNAAIPGDGMPITCRIRAEDNYGTDEHSTSWASGSSICPTSTPTPTPSPTPTETPTPTPTP
ncbi:fibronectin type III domain-containing protein [Candidatus Woesebacteria bacterium]|nr:fibronectin type III domain-containing protein [Candidatus Woesebacteria bacterium]